MLIEFKIQLTDDGVNVVQVPSNGNAPAPLGANKLPAAYPRKEGGGPPADPTGTGAARQVDGPPADPPGTGAPISAPISGSPATVLVLGPIVICGAGPGHTAGHAGGVGSGPPADGPGTGTGPPADPTGTLRRASQTDLNGGTLAPTTEAAKPGNRRGRR